MKKRVLVVDLDGTLFTINTFHYFVKYLLLQSLKNLKVLFLFKLCGVIFSRLYSTHSTVKYKILKLLNERTDVDYNKFVSSINSKKRVINCIENSSFSVKILATAAPSIYANIIAENESFDVCIGTDSPFGNYTEEFENSKEVKRKNVLNYLKTHNLEVIDMFITDHIDDLPLLKEANQNFIVNPDENFVKTLKQNSISFEVIP